MTDLTHNGSTTAADALLFIFAGKSVFTLVGKETRYTFRVRASKDSKVCFVGLLTGPDNTTDYNYIGLIPKDRSDRVIAGGRGQPNHPAFKALDWTMRQLAANPGMPKGLTILHAGKCGRCGRTLTVPESIETGYGPECVKFMT